MKKINIFLAGFFIISALNGCGTQDNLIIQDVVQNNNQNVNAQSNKGLKETFKYLLDAQFNSLDTNLDKVISIEEFAPTYTLPQNRYSSPAQKAVTNQGILSRIKNIFKRKPDPNIMNDIYARFEKVDKNKDSKISVSEAKNNPDYFLGRTKDNLREMAKYSFQFADQNKNNKVEKDELIFMARTQQGMHLLFTADKNKDNVLNFSEYEDIFYASQKAWATPMPDNNPLPIPVQPSEPVYSEPVPSEPGYSDPISEDPYVGDPYQP